MDGSVDSRVADYAQLQREYRNMELNRKAYADESNQVLRRQQAAVEKLRHDNEALKTELAMETRHVSSSKATSAQSQLASLHEQGDAYTGKIEGENRKVKTMEDQIQLLKQKSKHCETHLEQVPTLLLLPIPKVSLDTRWELESKMHQCSMA